MLELFYGIILVDTYCGDKGSIKGVLRESEEDAGFPNPRVPDE